MNKILKWLNCIILFLAAITGIVDFIFIKQSNKKMDSLKIDSYIDEIEMFNEEIPSKAWMIRIFAQNNGKNLLSKNNICISFDTTHTIVKHFVVSNEVKGELYLTNGNFQYGFDKWKPNEKFIFEVLTTYGNGIKPIIITNNREIQSIDIDDKQYVSFYDSYSPNWYDSYLSIVDMNLPKIVNQPDSYNSQHNLLYRIKQKIPECFFLIIKWLIIYVCIYFVVSPLYQLYDFGKKHIQYYKWFSEKHEKFHSLYKILCSYYKLKNNLGFIIEDNVLNNELSTIFNEECPEKPENILKSISMIIFSFICSFCFIIAILCLYYYL
ncbi:MAG: hypothetical protein LBH04_06365 [Tannerellaceae bacterium]|jgi:hypothetical protein|nr:hypothetical protein [Tannerellaceae bacterium]